jgi:hypothetical protein
LKGEGGDVLTEELQLQRIVDNQARASGVMVSRYAPGVRAASGRTNQFFEDQGLSIDFTAGGKELVEFLVGLAAGNSMIRVQDVNLRPDGTGTRLAGNIQFIASYQRKAPIKAVSTVSGAPIKPAATVPPKTNAAASKPKTNAPPKGATNTQAKPNAATNSATRPQR